MEAAAYAATYGLAAIVMAVYYVVILAVAVVGYIALWKIFQKAGEPGWKCLIPFYGGYTMYKLFWKPVYYWLTVALEVVLIVPTTILQGQMILFGEPSLGLAVLVIVLALVVMVVAIVWSIKLYLGMARSFGYGGGFAAGLFFVPLVFELILAFGKDTYKGNTYIGKAAPATEPWTQPPVIDDQPPKEEN